MTSTGLRAETERLLKQGAPAERAIVILGDSIAYGWGLSYAQSYPALLEGLLNEQGDGRAWRVINAGVPGDTIVAGALRYARDVRPFHPRVVVVAFGLNDAAPRRTQFDAQRERAWRAQHDLCARMVSLARRALDKALRWAGVRRRRSELVHREAAPRVGPHMFVRCLRGLLRQARKDGATVYVLSLAPWCQEARALAQPGTEARAYYEALGAYNRLIIQAARREGATLIPLGGAYGGPFVPRAMLSEDGVHLNAAGQEWFARQVYEALRRADRFMGDNLA